MTKEQRTVCLLVNIGCGGTPERLPSGVDYEAVLRISARQGVSCVAMDGLERVVETYGREGIPQAFVLSLFSKRMNVMRDMEEKWRVSAEFAKVMSPHRCVVLKGIDFAHYWPKPLYREFGDLDCWFGERFAEVNRRASERGWGAAYTTAKHTHISFKGLTVENHRVLTNRDGSRFSAMVEQRLMELMNEGDITPIGETGLWSPGPMLAGVFMLRHAQGHFMSETTEMRQFLDWMFFVDAMADTMDWDRMMGVLDELKLRRFADMMSVWCATRLGWRCAAFALPPVSESLLRRVDEYVFSQKADLQDRSAYSIGRRLLKRFVRLWRFRELNSVSVARGVWNSIVHASKFDKKPKE